MEIEVLLEKLKEFEKEAGIGCKDFCIDCLENVTNNLVEHERKGHTIVHECLDRCGITEWIRCIEWLIKKGYLKNI
jgi:hypothetical protein